jgi:two-component system, OmpR family, sensor kinase
MAVTSPPARLWNSARQLPGRTPLRVKLITAVLALVLVALAAISFAGISFLSRYLLGQADDQLTTLTGFQLERTLQSYAQNPAPTDVRGEAITWAPDSGGEQQIVIPVALTGIGVRARVVPGPQIPADASALPADPQKAVTVTAESGGGRWRIVGLPATLNNPDGTVTHGTVIVGTDVTSVYSTLSELAGIDAAVSIAAILVLALVGVAVVRASLRPLTDIEQTAGAIAAGDLTRRVPDRDPRTEVGRLGRSLNAMLAQIETAFRARAASEAAARRSEERIRQFVADASHELRTPLTAIRGFAEYYRQRGGLANGRPEDSGPEHSAGTGSAGTQDGPARELAVADPGAAGSPRGGSPLTRVDLDRIMRRVEQESSRMGVLVEDMLLLARLDQQRPLESRPVDLLTLAADAVHDARVMAPRRSIDLTVGAGAALIVLGDEVRLRQVIGNLMSNALTHTPDGTPVQVRIRSGALDEGSADAGEAALPPPGPGAETSTSPPAVILEVADRGPGLTPEQAERAFERFYRADQARARQAGGTGLGLAIVAALVVAHGGRVSVEPTPGSGATFRIALPLAPEALAPEAPDPEAPDPEAPGPGAAGQPDEEPHAGPGPAAS